MDWFWAHDIRPHQIDSLAMPGARLVRLAQYDGAAGRRFAAVVHRGAGASWAYRLDVPVGDLDGLPGIVGITGTGATGFSVLLDPDGPPTRVRTGLDAAALLALPAAGLRVVDVAADGDRYVAVVAAVVAAGDRPSWTVVASGARDLDRRHRRLAAVPVRIRAGAGGGLVSVAEPRPDRGGDRWFTDLDADAVARALDRHRSYPVDLDAVGTASGVRFSVVMRRER